MVWRSLVMRTRSSRAASSGFEGARGAAGLASGGCGRRGGRPLGVASSMSPLVTRPSLPLPFRVAGSMPDSRAILATAGP